MIELAGKRVLIAGMARSGAAAARLALARGARQVVCTDLRVDAPRIPGTEAVYGHHRRSDFTEADLIIVSPGVPASQPDIRAAQATGVLVVGELALAASILAAHGIPLLAITGTNGKSSVTHFLGQLLEQADLCPFVGGNIGRPVSELAIALGKPESPPENIAVIEVSSYQLELAHEFQPTAGVVLNLTPDHLKRHGTMAGYAAAKMKLFAHMGPGNTAILPPEHSLLSPAALQHEHGPAVLFLGGLPGVTWDATRLLFQGSPDDGELDISAFPIPGVHNRLNLAAACLLALQAGVPRAALRPAALQPLAHRLELVHQAQQIKWINDSKATNIDSARAGIEGLDAPLLVLLGGQGKAGADYLQLRPALAQKARLIICFGASRQELKEAFLGLPTQTAESLDQAVQIARAFARAGDTVLLSPACASFDEFRDFEHRGEVFRDLARGPSQSPSSPGERP